MEEILSIKQKYTDFLMRKANVVAVGIGYRHITGINTGEPSIIVSVSQKVPCAQLSIKDQVPRFIEDVRTDVQQTGFIRALDDRTGRWRPAPGGVSIGHINITAGTLGCLVKKDNEQFILSNNHVLANANQAEIGDAIVQPGIYDGGTSPDDQIATLADFVPVQFAVDIPDCPIAQAITDTLSKLPWFKFEAVKLASEANLVDCAIAYPLNDEDVQNQILEVGVPIGSAVGELGTKVKKSGRTSGLTEGVITQTDMTVQVLYGTAIAMFEDQLASDLHSEGGDSGSAVLNENNEVVGLLFAGGEGITIFNKIQHVTEALGVSL